MTGALVLHDTQPVQLPLDLVDPHPDNPRITRRDDVIDLIAAEITRDGRFGTEHSILVRPHGDRYQVVSGHNRREAALKAGIDHVPAWVRDMGDDEAFMQLVLGNAQGELSPLEIGLHAAEATKRWKRGDGLTAYAGRLDKSLSTVSRLRSAAEVYRANLATWQDFPVTEYHRHLAEISKAPRNVWPLLVSELARREWSVKETAAAVADVNKFDIPDDWRDWLPLPAVVERYLAGRFSPDTVNRLIAAADDVVLWIDNNGWDKGDQCDDFVKWLCDEEVTDRRQIGQYKAQLIGEKQRRDAAAAHQAEEEARAAYVVPGWHHGRWQQFVDELKDGSVSLLLTDPPYGMSFVSGFRGVAHKPIEGDDGDPRVIVGEMARTLYEKLTDGAHVLVFASSRIRHVEATMAALADAGLRVRDTPLIWAKGRPGMGDLHRDFAPSYEVIVHATKGDGRLFHRPDNVLTYGLAGADRHPTEKPEPLLAELIEATTAPGQLVADPFGGVASTAAAAKATDRRWWSCETDDGYWQTGEGRLS